MRVTGTVAGTVWSSTKRMGLGEKAESGVRAHMTPMSLHTLDPGTFFGHALPGSLLLLLGVSFGLFGLLRDHSHHASLWLPRWALVAMAATTLSGSLYSMLYDEDATTMNGAAHDAMFLGWSLVGFTALLESIPMLQVGSHVHALALCLGLQGVGFVVHATMQKGTEQLMHICLAMVSFVSTLAFLAASWCASCVWLLAWPSVVLQGLWFWYIALEWYANDWLGLFARMDAGIEDPGARMLVVPHLSILILLVATLVVLCAALRSWWSSSHTATSCGQAFPRNIYVTPPAKTLNGRPTQATSAVEYSPCNLPEAGEERSGGGYPPSI